MRRGDGVERARPVFSRPFLRNHSLHASPLEEVDLELSDRVLASAPSISRKWLPARIDQVLGADREPDVPKPPELDDLPQRIDRIFVRAPLGMDYQPALHLGKLLPDLDED